MHRTHVAAAICFISSLHAASEKPVGPLSLYQQCISIIAQREIDRPETYSKTIPAKVREDLDALHGATYVAARNRALQAEDKIALLDPDAFTTETQEALNLAAFIAQTQAPESSIARTARFCTHYGITPRCIKSCCAVAGSLSLACGVTCCGLHYFAAGAAISALSLPCGGLFLAATFTKKKWDTAYLNLLLPDYSPIPQPMVMDLE